MHYFMNCDEGRLLHLKLLGGGSGNRPAGLDLNGFSFDWTRFSGGGGGGGCLSNEPAAFIDGGGLGGGGSRKGSLGRVCLSGGCLVLRDI